MARERLPVRMIAGTAEGVPRKDHPTLHQKDAGHHEDVRLWSSDAVSFEQSPKRGKPTAGAQKSQQTGPSDAETSIKTHFLVCNARRSGPKLLKEGGAFPGGSHVEEQGTRIVWVAFVGAAKILHRLAAEHSAEVPEKYEQPHVRRKLRPQGRTVQVSPLDRELQQSGGDGGQHGHVPFGASLGWALAPAVTRIILGQLSMPTHLPPSPLTAPLLSAAGSARPSKIKNLLKGLGWVLGQNAPPEALSSDSSRLQSAIRYLPFALMHLACLGVIWVGFSKEAMITAVVLYFVRMFAITGFYHRYFSHKSFKTSRPFQFFMAFLGGTAVQRGALWWAAHHRHHHRFSDQEEDLHSPIRKGFFYSHMGWFHQARNFATRFDLIRDFAKFPELRFINRFDTIPGILMGVALYFIGEAMSDRGSSVTGWQLVIWGAFISTVVVYHATYTINSLAHIFGSRRYETTDTSRNNFWLSLLTLGEGWHNNHHYYQASCRQGFYWWEVDITYYGLRVLSWFGLIWDLKPVPERVRSRTIAPPQ